jgi:hypothetical protein
MRALVLVLIAACTPPPPPTTPSCPPAPADAGETKLGYLSYNGRCPSFGVQFSETPHVDPVVADGRLCALFPPIENLPIENQMRHDVIAALIDKHVKVRFAKVDEGTIHVSAVEPAP